MSDQPDSADPRLNKTRRRLPHWTVDGSTYFVTFRLASGTLCAEEQRLAFDHIRQGDGVYYRRVALVVMPDHVHLVLRPEATFVLSRIMRGIKGASARKINQRRGARGPVWQDESWDRIIRDETELIGILQYIVDNPVKAGLCLDPEQYPWLWILKDDSGI